ncbi:MAG TPA: ribonuclease H-like domain-containing protein [Flexivirga sp.]|uniref:ribonuclease H-like domain-containing protein n=1 Tax=Flexivirga sp. TaxID=1962927 RepID=UPI002BDD1189|nr:ribonuclease H-like domain-containing protein [Flexivirga sp.]HWC22962.1 ribonuclease H-like domain-containing protein [Flexivirga sp.]
MSEVFLGGYPAKKCPRVVHNEHAPGTLAVELPVPAHLQILFDAGRAFQDEVVDVLRDVLDDGTFIDADQSWNAATDATVTAMRRGDAVIVGGRLPDIAARRGAPDLLVRVGAEAAYLPVDIKHHHTLSTSKTKDLTFSTIDAPMRWESATGVCNRGGHWRDDVMQLAHYTRMLQELGFHPGDDRLYGGILGTDSYDGLTPHGCGITWYDLTEAGERTFSASAESGRKLRSPLERYDHEFDFRVQVAQAARDGRELVRPIGTDECFDCVWAEQCEQVVGPDDAGFALRHGRLRTREWQFLASRGVTTLADLAALEVDADLLDGFVRHAAGRQGAAAAEKALRAAVTKADLTLRGVDIEPIGDTWPAVPTADVEIDFDIEWDRAGRIYQYGLRIRDAADDGTARYEPVVSFEPLDDAGAAALADQVADRLEELIADAEQRGHTLMIFHWSAVEISRTRCFPRLASLLEDRSVDLLAWASGKFVARKSFSIKDIAPIFGFEWGVDDAGGFSSMDKIEHARGTGPDAAEARTWCLDYNEADVAAQAAIRDGLRALENAPLMVSSP